MRKIPFTFVRGGYREPCSVTVGFVNMPIKAGSDDTVYVYRDKDNIYVLSENHRLDYIGLERFNRHTHEREFDIFFQTDDGSGDRDWLLQISRIPTKINFMLQWDM